MHGTIRRTLDLHLALVTNQSIRRASDVGDARVQHEANLLHDLASFGFVRCARRCLYVMAPIQRLRMNLRLGIASQQFGEYVVYVIASRLCDFWRFRRALFLSRLVKLAAWIESHHVAQAACGNFAGARSEPFRSVLVHHSPPFASAASAWRLNSSMRSATSARWSLPISFHAARNASAPLSATANMSAINAWRSGVSSGTVFCTACVPALLCARI